MKRGPRNNAKCLLTVWYLGDIDAELPYSLIVVRARQFGIQERTVINYLNLLVETKILEKSVNTKRNTFYKPLNKTEVMKAILRESIDGLSDFKLKAFLKCIR